MPKKLTEEQK